MELKKYWNIIWRRKLVVAIITLLTVLFTLALLEVTPRIYKSRAKVLFSSRTMQQMFITGIKDSITQITFTNTDFGMGTIEELIESEPVIKKVIDDLGLRDSEGKALKMDDFTDPSVVKLFMQENGVDVEGLEASEVFEIIGYSSDPARAEQISSQVVSNFQDEFAKRYRQEMIQARETIIKRIDEVRMELTEAEQKVEQFKLSSQFYSPAIQLSTLVSSVDNLENDKSKTLRALAEAKKGLQNIKEASWADRGDLKDIQVRIESNTVIDEYKKQLLGLETSLAKTSAERAQGHPDVIALNKQIEVVQSNIRKEITKGLASQIVEKGSFYDNFSRKYSDNLISIVELEVRAGMLENQIRDKKNELSRVPSKERMLNELMRDADALKTTYAALLSDLENVRSAEKLNLSNAFTVQPAPKASVYFPAEETESVLAGAAAGGLCLGIFFAFMFNYLSSAITEPQEIKQFLQEAPVIVFPWIRHLQRTLDISTNSPFAVPVHNLLTGVRVMLGKELKVISLVSPARGDGRSTVASHLAYTIARGDRKVMLIDGDLAAPSLHEIFGIPLSKGLVNYLAGDVAAVDNVISKTFLSNLDIITAGSLQGDGTYHHHLRTRGLGELIEYLSGRYDFIIFDTPPFSAGADTMIISAASEGAVMVLREGKNSGSGVKEIKDNLDRAKVKVAGSVFFASKNNAQ
ncbi:MAG: polysaccharide biosynthesis tyrosine autokinase [Nitrospirae bacterium]|nr:polysaccharide biosynthesis tyrosine autokinase [Nitrospirota bacterium]